MPRVQASPQPCQAADHLVDAGPEARLGFGLPDARKAGRGTEEDDGLGFTSERIGVNRSPFW